MIVHVSLDIETFSSRGDAALASIGAFAFTLDPDIPGIPLPFGNYQGVRTFYETVNDPDGHYDPETIRWHAKQDDPVASTGGDQKAVTLPQALSRLGFFLDRIRGHQRDEGKHDLLIWSHATFDAPIVSLAAARSNCGNPWGYRDTRDLRTLYQMTPGGRPSPADILEAMTDLLHHVGLISHRSLDDAIWQAYEVAICFERIAAARGDEIVKAWL